MKYELVHLGAYANYSEDPAFAGDLVVGGQDRPGSDEFATYAAVCMVDRRHRVSWTRLPDLSKSSERAVVRSGLSSARVVLGHCDGSAATGPGLRPVLWSRTRGGWAIQELPVPDGTVEAEAVHFGRDEAEVFGEVVLDGGQKSRIAWWRNLGGGWFLQDLIATLGGPRAYSVRYDPIAPGLLGNSLVGDPPLWRATFWRRRRGKRAVPFTPRALKPLKPVDGSSLDRLGTSAGGGYADRCAGASAQRRDGPMRAVLWTGSGSPCDLRVGDDSEATGFAGPYVIGNDRSRGRAFRWSRQDGVEDIHPNGWRSSTVWGGDGAGRIVGVGDDGTGVAMFLLVPAATPSAASRSRASSRRGRAVSKVAAAGRRRRKA